MSKQGSLPCVTVHNVNLQAVGDVMKQVGWAAGELSFPQGAGVALL